MALDTTALVSAMSTAGQGLGTAVWNNIQTFALPELQKIATQIIAIETGMLQNPPQYTQDGAKALFNMQINASVGVIVAMTALTLLAVQAAINQMIAAVKTMVNTALKFTLIA